MKPAVWYGLFTGGMNGEIAEFGREEVRVVGTRQASVSGDVGFGSRQR